MTDTMPQTRILVVDDEQKTQKILKRFLENKQFEVMVAGDGKDALEKFDAFNPECVLLDIQMPHLNGTDTLKIIKARNPEVVVIMVTAVTTLEIAEGCLNDGAYSVIEKPVNFEYLHSKIEEALKLREEALRKNRE
jgi:DNA-binding NtrC family response regulator